MHIVGNFSCTKLKEICNPFDFSSKNNEKNLVHIGGFNPWRLSKPIDVKELEYYAINKIEETSFKSTLNLSDLETTEYNYARIAYFINNGWEDPIYLKFGTIENDYWPNWVVIDGNHRYCAAIFLNMKKIFGIIKDLENGFDYHKFIYNDQEGIV